MDAVLDKIWGVFVGLGWWMLNRMTAKIDSLEKEKASGNDLNGVRKNLGDDMTGVKQGLRELDRRVDEIDHATQLQLVPRSEYKADISALHSRCNVLSDTKEDKVQDIRIVQNADDKKKGK